MCLYIPLDSVNWKQTYLVRALLAVEDAGLGVLGHDVLLQALLPRGRVVAQRTRHCGLALETV